MLTNKPSKNRKMSNDNKRSFRMLHYLIFVTEDLQNTQISWTLKILGKLQGPETLQLSLQCQHKVPGNLLSSSTCITDKCKVNPTPPTWILASPESNAARRLANSDASSNTSSPLLGYMLISNSNSASCVS